MPRLVAINTLHLSVVSSQLLKAVAEHKGLRRLLMIETKLTEVPAKYKYRYKHTDKYRNKGIRDAGSTADFRILLKILKFKKLEI